MPFVSLQVEVQVVRPSPLIIQLQKHLAALMEPFAKRLFHHGAIFDTVWQTRENGRGG